MSNLADPASPSTKSHARVTLRWLGTATLLGWLALGTDWSRIGLVFAGTGIGWMLTATGLLFVSQLASVARWHLLVRAAGFEYSRRHLLAVYFEGMFVNLCLPTTVGGDVLKVFRIGGSHDKRAASATVIADRASGLVALAALLGTGLLLKFDDIRLAFAAASLVLIGIIAVFLGVRLVRSQHDHVPGRALQTLVQRIPTSARKLIVESPWHRVLVWALVVQALNVIAVAAVAFAIGVSVPPAGILVATTTASLAAALPISIAGIGIREASLPLLLAADGVPREAAIALGLAWSAIVLAVGLFGAPAHFAAQRRRINGADSAPPVAPPLRRAA